MGRLSGLEWRTDARSVFEILGFHLRCEHLELLNIEP